ncbi:MAG: tyrosine-type recombinase/integrase [Lachnospiraceae bacterium]|nr:tyrosine-type recombinase/integrase [Lachnospiraceae bacterium]
MGLTWDCVDFKNGTITIEKQMANMRFEHEAFQIIKKPKSQKSIRTLHFSETVKKELSQLKNLQSWDMQLLGEDYVYVETETVDLKGKKVERVVRKHMIEDKSKELCLVCRKRNGGHIQSKTVEQFMKVLSKKVGFHCASHIGRHTHATLLLEEGANIANISARLGHNGSDITMQYLHSSKDADYDISNRIEKAILSTE